MITHQMIQAMVQILLSRNGMRIARVGLRMFATALTFVLALSASAQPLADYAKVSGELNSDAIPAGGRAVIAIVLDVNDGYHAQSHTPLDKDLVPYQIALEAPVAGVKFGEPDYPLGDIREYPALGKLSVYTGRVTAYADVFVPGDAPVGPISFKGTASFQICNDKTCFPPTDVEFEVSTRIVPAGTVVQKRNTDVFAEYGKRARASSAQASVAPTEPATMPALAVNESAKWSIGYAFGAAFIAGILFNVVPCVLPVLPIKVLGFAEVAQHDRTRTVLLATIFGAGIVTVFAVLAVLILVLKQLSWGQQFSNPWFAWGMVIVLLLLSMWLFGMLNFNLPTTVYSFSPRHDTMTGNYLWGVLTAVLSTPCTGPLFPPLMIWAQGQPTALGVPAMMIVGVGMAFPYVLLSAFPEAARKFPRVGPWAELFKQMLGFALLGFTVYFAAGRFMTIEGATWAIVPVAMLAAIYLMARTVQLGDGPRPVAIAAVIAVTLLTSSTLLACKFSGVFDEAPAGGAANAFTWTPYSDDALAAAQKANKVVLVKFTANWCLNCQYIEGTVFHDPKALESLRQHDVVALKADLTQKSAPGWPRLLELNPTGGIPLTALYAPRTEKPLQLTDVYTTATLIKALDQLDRR